MDWDAKKSNPFLLCFRQGNFPIKPKYFKGFFLFLLLFKMCLISHHLPWRMFSQHDIYIPWQFLPTVQNKLAEKLVCSTSKQCWHPSPSSLGPLPQWFRSIPPPTILCSLFHSILHFFSIASLLWVESRYIFNLFCIIMFTVSFKGKPRGPCLLFLESWA